MQTTPQSPFRIVDQVPEPHANWYRSDPAFQALLRRLLSPEALAWLEPQLDRMGADASLRVDPLARAADKQSPQLRSYDPYGRRVDQIVHHPAYREMERIGYGSGMVGLKYDPEIRRRFPATGNVMGYALGYLFGQAESGLYCPICMTDGAARVLERYGTAEQQRRVIPRLASRDVESLWRGAMFLTEKQGGSDVGAAGTRAVPDGAGGWRLTGEKWFCSNVDAEVILALGRPDGAPAGTRGLGLFLVLREGGHRPGLRIDRIKDKLGVRSMATGEVVMDGVEAELVGPVDKGFKAMTVMINCSRLYNAVASVAVARRALLEATRYLRARRTFGRTALEHPLLREALANLQADHLAATALTFQTAEHVDRADAGSALDERRMRLLTPLVKYSTARLSVAAASEAIELIGGNGYIEDFVTPRLLRDAQVLPVWEGTTNILLLDVLRTCLKERGQEPLFEDLASRLASAPAGLEHEAEAVGKLSRGLADELGQLLATDPARQAMHVRRWADRFNLAFSAGLLIEGSKLGGGSGAGAELAAAAVRRLVRNALEPAREPRADDTAALVERAVLE